MLTGAESITGQKNPHQLYFLKNILSILLATGSFLLFGNVGTAEAQDGDRSYEFLPAPDLWYNDVDGIRAGLRLRGQVPGSFEDGPHRLDAGIWLGTWMPDDPVSYYISFTEPIPAISDFASEGSIRAISSIRTGFHQHGIGFQKRWQQGFEEQNYQTLNIGVTAQKRYDLEYTVFPSLWQTEWLYLANLQYGLSKIVGSGSMKGNIDITSNLAGNAEKFSAITGEVQHRQPLGKYFRLNSRLFGFSSVGEVAPEFQVARGFRPASGWMNNGFTRAKGTIPTPWVRSGLWQVEGGPNLRGYNRMDIEQIDEGNPELYNSFGALNLELDYPNPIDNFLKDIPMLGGLLEMRSYLFLDAGTPLADSENAAADAGAGILISLNIPDYLGNPRGITFRYDVPFWLSDPEGSNHFGYRNQLGLGAVISF